jgi:hypothetical protein
VNDGLGGLEGLHDVTAPHPGVVDRFGVLWEGQW